MNPEEIEAIAQRTAELLARRDADHYVGTATLARMLETSPDWVRAHAAELGGVRIGNGPKGALRFEIKAVQAALKRRQLTPTARGAAPRRRRRRPGTATFDLLPLPE